MCFSLRGRGLTPTKAEELSALAGALRGLAGPLHSMLAETRVRLRRLQARRGRACVAWRGVEGRGGLRRCSRSPCRFLSLGRSRALLISCSDV